MSNKISNVLNYLVAFNQNFFCRSKKAPLPPVLFLLLFLLYLVGPVYGFVKLPSKEKMTVHITGTINFGEEVVFDRKIEVRIGATAGEALEQAVKIEMAGSYIETIEREKTLAKNSSVSKANKAPKDNRLTSVASESSPPAVKNSQRPTDFWWLIPLVIILGAGLWWIKKKKRSY